MIFINFKTYQEGTGQNAEKLARICQEVAKESGVEIIVVVQAADILRLSRLSLPVWAQHVDDITFGPNTGQILPEAVLEAGAKGTLLNHSEKKLPLEVIKKTTSCCQSLGLKVLACADNLEEAKEIIKENPNFLAYEPPELIGSRTVSVSTAKKEVVADFTSQIKKIPVLVGAGIHSQEDVRLAIKLGAAGILVATDIVLAKDPRKELLNLAQGFKK
jgi:triosephosphate isomerase